MRTSTVHDRYQLSDAYFRHYIRLSERSEAVDVVEVRYCEVVRVE